MRGHDKRSRYWGMPQICLPSLKEGSVTKRGNCKAKVRLCTRRGMGIDNSPRPGLFQSGARASCAMSQQMAAGKARVTVLSGRGPWVNPKKCGAPKGCAQGHAREPGAWLFCSSKDYGTGAVNPLDSLTAPAVSPPRLGEAALNPLNCFTIQHFFIFIQQGGYFCQFILRHLWIRKHGRAGCQ